MEEFGRQEGRKEEEEGATEGLAMEEFLEEEAGKALGVVADDAVLLDEIIEDDAEAELLELGEIDGHRFGAFRAVAAGDIGRDGTVVGDHPINDTVRNVFLNGAKVIGERVAGGLAGLRHQIGDVHARRLGLGNGSGDFRDQQIRENAGVERAGTEKNQVGLLDGINGTGERTHAARGEAEFLDRGTAGGDARFAVDGAVVFERGDEVDVRKRRRKDAAANGEDFAADADGFGEIAGDVRERGEKEIAEIVAGEAAAGVKAILKQAAEQGFVFRKGDHAVADVAGRKNTVLAAQTAGAAAVVGDGDDGGEVGDGALAAGVFIDAAEDVLLEPAEKRGKTGAAAEGDHSEAARERFRIGDAFFHSGVWDGSSGFISWKGI